ncbi:MAG: OmcA/MtrC family decaheme c-type cytochrome [Thermodesulfobacteriota bacterium]
MSAKSWLNCKYSFCFLLSIILSGLSLTLIGCGNGGGGGTAPPPTTSENKLNVEILDASISSNPVVTFKLTNDQGNPVDRSTVTLRFIIARIEKGDEEYTDYITRLQQSAVQADFEGSGANPLGTFEDMPNGVSKYTFNKALPENFDRNVTHTVGIFATRDFQGKTYVSNAFFDFVPSGGQVTTVRDIVRIENCNNCHDPLEAHGGSRRDVRLCVLCHTTEIIDPNTGQKVPQIDPDTGNNIGFEVLIHKIHRGAELPSVVDGPPGAKYSIIGGRTNETEFVFAEKKPDETVEGIEFPQDIRNCDKCHTGGTQSDHFKTEPSRFACGSCHDDIDFENGEDHLRFTDDNSCSSCHLPSTGDEFDISVEGAHTVPLKSRQLAGVNFAILNVESFEEPGNPRVAPGQHPKVTFRVTTDEGEVIPPSSLNSLRLILAGPTTEYNIHDYNNDGVVIPGDPTSPYFIILPGEVPSPGIKGGEAYQSEDPRQSAQPDGDGNFTYTFKAMIPNGASGTYTIGIEGYKLATVEGKTLIEDVRDAGHNVVFDFPVTDAQPVLRRIAVSTSEKCRSCHEEFSSDFSIHGNIRNDSKHCVLCHNPSYDTLSRQVPDVGEPVITKSVNFRVYIHKIHRGERLTIQPYELYGPPRDTFPNQTENASNFGEIRFPGDLRDCEACHFSGTYILDPGKGILGNGILPTTNREFVYIKGETTKTVTETFFTSPIISVCTACHDDVGVNETGDGLTGVNHSIANIVASESECVECHGAGEPLSVDAVHLPPLPFEKRIERPQ